MSNILVIYTQMEPPVLLTEKSFRPIVEPRGSVLKLMQTSTVTVDDLLWSDVVIAIRTQSILESEILKAASKMGRFCIESIDDDFFAMKDHAIRRPLQERALRQALSTVDFILSPNITLAQKMCVIGGGKPYFSGDTVVSESEIASRKRVDSDDMHIVYYVNDGSTGVFDAVVKPLIPDLLKKYQGKLKLTLMSLRPDLSEFEGKLNVCYRPRTSLPEFKAYLRENHFTMGIAPLLDDEFSRGKYINKFIEFSSAGIPCIYSNVAPYAGFIKDGESGILCENTKESWLAAIDQLSDPARQENIVNAAQKMLREHFSPESEAKKILAAIPQLIQHEAPKNIKAIPLWPAHVKASLWSMADPFLKAWGRFRLEGFGSVIKWTWEHYITKRK